MYEYLCIIIAYHSFSLIDIHCTHHDHQRKVSICGCSWKKDPKRVCSTVVRFPAQPMPLVSFCLLANSRCKFIAKDTQIHGEEGFSKRRKRKPASRPRARLKSKKRRDVRQLPWLIRMCSTSADRLELLVRLFIFIYSYFARRQLLPFAFVALMGEITAVCCFIFCIFFFAPLKVFCG